MGAVHAAGIICRWLRILGRGGEGVIFDEPAVGTGAWRLMTKITLTCGVLCVILAAGCIYMAANESAYFQRDLYIELISGGIL